MGIQRTKITLQMKSTQSLNSMFLQEFESCLNLSSTETENLNNLFQDINQVFPGQSSEIDADPDYSVEEESDDSIETDDESIESNVP